MDEKKTLRVLIKEPDKAPYVKEIADTLEAKQEIVGGLIECVEMPDMRNVDLFVNEEGKLDNLKGNFWLPEYEDCVVGTCFMVGYNPEECDNVSITDEQVEQCKKYIENYVIPKGMDLYLDFNILEPYMKNQFKKVKKQKMEM